MPRARRSADPTEEASRWVIRQSEQALDDESHAAFNAWYHADTRHAAAYDRLSRLWRRMGEIDHGKLTKRTKPGPRKRNAAALLVLLASAWPLWHLVQRTHPGADYASGAQVLQVALPDGSRATLDADSAIAIDFSPRKREVRLLAGRALFTAAPRQADGPAFTVVTPEASATALGTRYEVAQQGGGTRVTVYEHRVAVTCLACDTPQTLTVSPGESADVSAAGLVRQTTPQEPAPDWSQGLLAFNDVALPDAAARLSRYTGKHIVVLGASARHARVSGTAAITDPKRALALLLAQSDVTITELPGLLILR